MSEKNILKTLFETSSNLWNSFLETKEELNSLYYPSAGEDLRPFVFSKKENLEFIGLNTENTNYIEPNLFIFSDYFPFRDSRFFDSKILHSDIYTSIVIEDYCEITPTSKYLYNFNKQHVHFEPSIATGRAIFFKVKINSHRVKEEYFKYGIYFFYENVNLLEQLFLKNNFQFTHLVWKRDGSGFGGGCVKLDFIYHIAARCNTKFFFIWDLYLDDDNCLINNNSKQLEGCPNEIKEIIKDDKFELVLEKRLKINWEIQDKMNFYLKKNKSNYGIL